MRNLVGGFGWLFGLGVVALVARYGFISSDNQVNGAILAFLFAGLAAGGLFGHAVAVHIWRIHRGWSITLGLICVAALVLNISNSLGAIAGRDDKTISERSKVKETRADDRAELQRQVTDHKALPPFTATTEAAVRAARDAVTAAERIRAAECDKRGTRCRERETEEQAKRDALAIVLANRAATERADKLDAEIKRLRERLNTGDVVRSVNPQGAIFAKLFKLPDSEADTAATWQQFAMSIVVDLLIMACFIAHEVMGWETRRATPPAILPAPAAPVTIQPPAPQDAPRLLAPDASLVARFMLACLPRSDGEEISRGAIYKRFLRWCDEQKIEPLTIPVFWAHFEPLCKRVNIRMRSKAGKVYCVGVKLAA